MNTEQMNILVMAYLGDAVYENFIRHYLISRNISKVEELQKESLKYVSAKSQDKILTYLLDNNLLKEDEISIFKRARNAKVHHHPKNTDIVTYKYATALEAIIGYLDIKNKDRLNEIMDIILKGEF